MTRIQRIQSRSLPPLRGCFRPGLETQGSRRGLDKPCGVARDIPSERPLKATGNRHISGLEDVRLYPYVAYIDCCFVGVHNPPRHVRLLLMASLSLIPNLQSILLGTSALAVAADVGIVHRSSSNISNCLGERLLHRFTPAGKWNHTHRLKQRWSLHHIASRIKVPRIANRDEQERPLMPVVSAVADNQAVVVDARGDV
jgi:hypothetical protein